MSSQKPKTVLRQISFIICLSLASLVFALAFARGEGEIGLIPSDFGGKDSLISVKIDSVDVSTPEEIAEIPIWIRNDVAIGAFELEIDFNFLNLTSYGAERGEALSDTSNGRYNWEYFSYRVIPYSDTLYKLILYGQYDLPDGHQGVPLAPNPDYVSLVVVKFQPANPCLASETLFPIIFEWEASDCAENTMSDNTGNILYVSQNPLQYDTTICSSSPSIRRIIEFADGGVSAFYDSVYYRGDINLDCISYTPFDFLLFVNFLDQGPDVFLDSDRQYPASDINADGINVTIADLVYMDRVIIHDAPAFPESFVSDGPESDKQADRMILGTAAAPPGGTVSLPLFFENTLPATGITFNIVFDSTLLSIQNVETIGTRLESWTQVHPVVKPGALFLHAMPNYLGESPSLDSLPAEFGTLVKINFIVSDQAPLGIAIPIEFQNDPYWQLYWGHYNAYTQDGVNFIQPTTVSGWISVSSEVLRGDVNRDGVVDGSDVVYLINYLFIGGPAPDPLELGDANCDGVVNSGDVVYLVNYLFIAGPPPQC
jgi:hypothetical protein